MMIQPASPSNVETAASSLAWSPFRANEPHVICRSKDGARKKSLIFISKIGLPGGGGAAGAREEKTD